MTSTAGQAGYRPCTSSINWSPFATTSYTREPCIDLLTQSSTKTLSGLEINQIYKLTLHCPLPLQF